MVTTDTAAAVATRLRAALPGAGRRLLLEVDLTEPLVDDVPTDPVGRLQARRRTTLRQLLRALRDGRDDPAVAGLVVRLGAGRVGLARAQEVAEAVAAFRRTGKPAVAWAESYGELTPATADYVLATAFDTVWLQPSGSVGLYGVGVTTPFLGEVLDRSGLEPQFGQRHEYKNAADTLMRTGFSEAHREAVTRLVDSVWEQARDAVAAGRGLDAEAVQALADRGPLLAREALDGGLVDRLGYRDEVLADLRARVGEEPELRYAGRYTRHDAAALARRLPGRGRRVVALVSAQGAIHSGRSRRSPLSSPSAGADTVTAALRAAGKAGEVGAVVLRVDSPGGSYVASDAIAREVRLLSDAGTPVVVSMGGVAASGGYFIAAPADHVVALPSTLTGSIGVLAGKVVVRRLAARVGLGLETVSRGELAQMFSPVRPFSDAEVARLDAWLDAVYDDFVDHVARGRRLPREQVAAVARGRVWTGADARDRGLVDELGGLGAAVTAARRLARLRDDAPLRRFPHLTPVDLIRPPHSSDDPVAAAVRLDPWAGFGGLAARLGLPGDGPLVVPPGLVGALGAAG